MDKVFVICPICGAEKEARCLEAHVRHYHRKSMNMKQFKEAYPHLAKYISTFRIIPKSNYMWLGGRSNYKT